MEEKILKRTAVFLTLISVLICGTIFYFPQLRAVSELWVAAMEEDKLKITAEQMNMTGLELLEYNNEQAKQQEDKGISFDSQLRLELPLGVPGNELKISQDYVTQTIDIKIPFADSEYFYHYPMLGRSDNIDSLTYEGREGYGVVEIVTSQVFEVESSYDKDYFYIDFLTPKEVYDKVIVIDAGHGGNAPGTTKQGVNEKDIDLDIVLKLKEIFDAKDDRSVGVYYTRTEDVNPSFENRVGLANKSDADLFISIHNNATQSGRMSNINGTQVMYDELDEDILGSRGLAQICLEEVTAQTGSSNKGIVEGNDIFIIRSSHVPAALIEVGFMTNQTELNNLKSEEYQEKVAQGIYNAVMRAFAEGY